MEPTNRVIKGSIYFITTAAFSSILQVPDFLGRGSGDREMEEEEEQLMFFVEPKIGDRKGRFARNCAV